MTSAVGVGTGVIAALLTASISILPSAPSGSAREILRPARLQIVLSGLPHGVRGAVVVRGPGGLGGTVGRSRVLSVRPGLYVVSVRRVRITRAHGRVAAGSVALAAIGPVRVRVRVGGYAIVAARYGTIESPRVRRLPDRGLTVRGNRLAPRAVVVRFAGHPGPGTIFVERPSSVLPVGLFDRVTRVSRLGRRAVLTLAPAALRQAFPELDLEGSVRLRSLPGHGDGRVRSPRSSALRFSFGGHALRCGPSLRGGYSFASQGSFSADAMVALHFPLYGAPNGRVLISLAGSHSLSFGMPAGAGCGVSFSLPPLQGAIGSLPLFLRSRLTGSLHTQAAWSVGISDRVRLTGGVSFDSKQVRPIVRLRSSPRVWSTGAGASELGTELELGVGSFRRAAVFLDFTPTSSFTAGTTGCELQVRDELRAGISYGPLELLGRPKAAVMPAYKCAATGRLGIGGPGGGGGGGGGGGSGGGGPGGPPPSSAPGWGYSSSGYAPNVLSSPSFTTLKDHLGIKYARVVVPIDTIATARNGTCDYDYLYAQSALAGLFAWLRATKAAGLTPLVGLTHGGAARDNSGNPLPNERNTDDAQYRCGLYYLIQATAVWASISGTSPVTEWEVFNEPDAGVCASQAAAFYVDAAAAEQLLGRSDTLVAGGFGSGDDPYRGNHPDCGHGPGDWYIPDYVKSLEADNVWPSVFSFHPFDDVAASGAAQDGTETTQTSDNAAFLNVQPGPPPAIWLTETGVWLRARASDGNGHTLGQDIDGNPAAQAWAAQGVLNLPLAAGQAYAGQIARVYYYELQTAGDGVTTGSDHFDSALVGIANADWSQSGSYDPRNGEFAVPRPSYCVLAYGDSPTAAVNDPRCDFTASPHLPWTDWEDPADLPSLAPAIAASGSVRSPAPPAGMFVPSAAPRSVSSLGLIGNRRPG